ncbi:PP2C family serine/threonine-protein phosphatase [Massilia sp. TS11]|uniref:PP2C family protein-serine/threonine phosphatase n=1 Tax=Massilia sp. TS11 TaxID=2908003 RepID=UPI001EDAA0A8|nr:protein phosphatase 2C domain-containing protein [Massilia sp. TS11]MCG2584527.1 protein phosphatase 2C domain-containing protein [Massilia sp. TS11]
MRILAPPLDFGPYEVAARSSVGPAPARAENQDNYLLIDTRGQAEFLRGQQVARHQLAHWPAGHVRVAVLDGMGGHGQGREVSEAVVAGLLSLPAASNQASLNHALDTLHQQLQAHFADSPGRRPGTTLTLLELPPGGPALLYHVGDSRLYALTGAGAQPLTVDHVPATSYALAGLLDAAGWWQQVHGEHRAQISQAFILGNALRQPQHLADGLYPLTPLNLPDYLAALADRRALALAPATSYVLASDGCWACADPAAWVAQWPALLAGAPGPAVERLFSALHSQPPPGLQSDNLTAIILRLRP